MADIKQAIDWLKEGKAVHIIDSNYYQKNEWNKNLEGI